LEAIADVNAPEHLGILMKLLELCFRDRFKNVEMLGLYSSICKALRNIAADNAELVLDQLNTVCRNTDNRKVKGYCNNMILDIEKQTQIVLCLNILERKLDIEKQYYEQLDIPWENGEIMKFVG
jgi:hypothetical protein